MILTVRDLGASRAFYCDALGFAISDQDRDALYLRGIEEACHHSLVLRQSADAPVCERVGLRVYTEDDRDTAKHYFERARLPAAFVEAPHQGCTLQVCDAVGTPLEFRASMAVEPCLVVPFPQHKGACPQRIHHFQILAPDVQGACEFSCAPGFRLSEFIAPDGTDDLMFVFLQRKGNPHDSVRQRRRTAAASRRIQRAGRKSHHPCLRHGGQLGLRRSRRALLGTVQHPLPGHGYRERAGALGSRRPAAAFLWLAAAPEMVPGGIALLRRRAARAGDPMTLERFLAEVG